jgi:DNA-binding response OmpR family regulator
MAEGKRILVLDDDPVVGLSCKRILGAEGFVVNTVQKGEDALRRLGQEEIDLLISDIRLPDIYGIEVLEEAKILQPRTDVVMITGYPTLEDAKEAIRLGAFEYLEKPFTPDFMLNVARRVFDKRGWILRKAFIDQFRQYITPASELDDRTIYYKEGTWARPLRDGNWELGFDVRQWYLSGQLLYVDLIEQAFVASGEPFARLLLGEGGKIVELKAPMSGSVCERNSGVNETLCSLVTKCLTENWLVWLLRINPKAAVGA